MSASVAGAGLAAYSFAKLLTLMGTGVISDRVGTRQAMIAGGAMSLTGTLAILPLTHLLPWVIVGAALLDGFGSSILWPAIYSAGAARFGAGEQARFSSALALASGFALLTGLGLGSVVSVHYSFDAAMALPISFTALIFALAITTGRHSEGRLETANEAPRALRDLAASRDRLIFWLVQLAAGFAVGAVSASYRAFGRDVLGLSLVREVVVLAPAAVLGFFSLLLGGMVADRIGPKWPLTGGFALAAASLYILGTWPSVPVATIWAPAACIGFAFAVPSLGAAMLLLAGPAGTRGGVIGLFLMAEAGGHTLGAAAAAVIIAAISAGAVLGVVGALFLAAALLSALIPVARPID